MSVTLGRPAPLVALSPRRREHCRRSRLLRPTCPELVPRVRATYLTHLSRQPPSPGAAVFHSFDLERGGEDPRRPERNRPPFMAHLTILAGAVERAAAFEHPLRGDAVPLRSGLLKTKRVEPLFFGRTRWAGRDGALFLAPPFLHGGQLGNHLCFRWNENGTDYLVSLHAWEPLPDAAATLRAVVSSALRG